MAQKYHLIKAIKDESHTNETFFKPKSTMIY